MKPKKQQLIHDLLDGDSRREAILITGARILRRRRQWRATSRLFALMALAIVVVLVEQENSRLTSTHISTPPAKPPAPFQARSLTDDELLALFPNTPVGLATLPDGRKLLIFPHAGDEARFITRL